MTGLLLTLLVFPLVGAAVGRIAGRVPFFLAGAGTIGSILFFAGVVRVPLMPVAIAIVVASAIVIIARPAPPPAPSRYALLPISIGATAAVWLLIITATVPLNDYDGRAFWLLKAKAIAHEQRIDGPFFQSPATSPRNQYPLLIPIDAATIFRASGTLDDRSVRWLYAFFAIAFALEIRRRFGDWYAAIFLWLPQIAIQGDGGATSAYNDIPLGAFAACAFFELADRVSPARFGMWLAFIALTKSEGLPLAFVLLLAGAFVFRTRIMSALGPFSLAGAALFAWRSRVPRSDENEFARMVMYGIPQHLDRFLGSLAGFARQAVAFRFWGLLWIAVTIAILVLLLRREWRPLALAAAVMLPMIVLYAAVFAVTDWEWSVLSNNLAPRLLTHLLGPAFFLIAQLDWHPWSARSSSA